MGKRGIAVIIVLLIGLTGCKSLPAGNPEQKEVKGKNYPAFTLIEQENQENFVDGVYEKELFEGVDYLD